MMKNAYNTDLLALKYQQWFTSQLHALKTAIVDYEMQ